MRTRVRWFGVVLLIIVVIIASMVAFQRFRCSKNLNVAVPNELRTAKELIYFSKSYVDKYVGKNNTYNIGEITMSLNSLEEGDVRITFVETQQSNKSFDFSVYK
ncbi:hypothetical protein [Paenibacillus sp. N3.4]|uniref:hypothetical protein n=1 Tax=Paenibacillus sp. N3.4 TaxID=2603222 RepID=UPI0011C93A92|nr:hypothetical protein [Paenibacillus sp. N3.4]TXK85131.1 hypothetical protein FU659_05135 [Paenibacillus sp. N3.4]